MSCATSAMTQPTFRAGRFVIRQRVEPFIRRRELISRRDHLIRAKRSSRSVGGCFVFFVCHRGLPPAARSFAFSLRFASMLLLTHSGRRRARRVPLLVLPVRLLAL